MTVEAKNYTDLPERCIDWAFLRPGVTNEDIRDAVLACYDMPEVRAVCVLPSHVRTLATVAFPTGVYTATVIDFPMGRNHATYKAMEIYQAWQNGCEEVDIVLNIGDFLENKRVDTVRFEIDFLGSLAWQLGLTSRYILELPLFVEHFGSAWPRYLSMFLDGLKTVYKERGGKHLKTATGFFGSTDVHMVRELRTQVAARWGFPDIQIKAAGGIKTFDDAITMLNAGANILGASSVRKIIAGRPKEEVKT